MKRFACLLTPFLIPVLASSLCANPADTLVGYWKMESTTGPVVADDAPAGATTDDGTWVGTPNYVAGVFGEAMELNGTNYLNVPHSTDTNKAGEDLTASAWFTISAWDTSWQCLLSKGEGSRYRVARRSSDGQNISYAGGTSDIFGGSVNDGNWHHVVAVSDHGTQMRLYVDGVRVATGGAPTLSDDGRPLLIGANPATNPLRQWKGKIDDVGIFDDAFDDATVAALYAIATDPTYAYDLGNFNELLKHYRCGASGGALQIGTITWTFSGTNPGDNRDFFEFNSDGSGLVATEAAILTFTANPEFIFTGQSSTLNWTTVGFTALTVSDGVNPPVDVTGTPGVVVSPTTTTTYTLSGTGPSGNDSAQVTVNVNAPPTVSLTASDTTIPSGTGTTLQWASSGAAAISINQGVGNVLPDTDGDGNGSKAVNGIVSTTTYTITATNPAGSAQDSVTIVTGIPPVINSFALVEPNPVPGEAVELTWDVSDADTIVISPDIGSVNPVSGTACDFPSANTTYTLTATNGFSQSTAQVTVTLPGAMGVDSNQWTVLHRTSTGTIDSLADADALLSGTGVLASQTDTDVPVINFGPGNSGEFGGDDPPPLGDALDDFVVRATATLVVNFPGTYTFGINNDDGGRLRINGSDVIVDDRLHAPTTYNGAATLAASTHTIEYVYFERGGGQAGEVFYVNANGVDELLTGTGTINPIATSDVIINEFMADNDGTLDDAEGQSSDWIELYNGTGSSINLLGYFLTDDAAVPNKWALPSYVLPSGGYLVVFASNKDTTFNGTEFHTNFKLNNNGEYLALSKIDGGGLVTLTEYSPAYPPQPEDVSYGTWGNSQSLGFMPNATPGSLNFGGVDGFVGDTHFDVDRGFHTAPFALTITTDQPGATIRYTTDGSAPTLNHGTVYTGPIVISQTTVIRAAGFLKGYEPTNVDTQTYIFLADIPLQDQAHAVALGFPAGSVGSQRYEYGMSEGGVSDSQIIQGLQDIPTISLVLDQTDFSDASTGIYSNAGSRGRGWERPCSIELINESGLGVGQFQKNAGVRIRGGFSRSGNNPKHAFRLFFRNDYEGDLRYPMFQDEGASRFENLDLRTSQNYSWSFQNNNQNSFLREVHGRDAQRELGQPYTRSRYYHLYLNGVYWGLYMSQERSENFYGETYLGGDEDDYDVIKSAGSSGGYRTEATDGDMNGAWADLHAKVRAIPSNPSDNAAYFAIQGLAADGVSPHADLINNPDLLEVENLIDYLIAIFYTGNYDAPLSTFLNGASNNWFGMRDRNGTDGFRFFVHDGEHSLGTGNNSNNRVGPWSTGGNYASQISQLERSNPQYLHEDLAFNQEYRMKFADRVHRAFFNGGPFNEPAALARLDSRYTIITDAVRSELARWGGGHTYTTWLNARQDIINFINRGHNGSSSQGGRAAYLLNLLRNYNHSGAKPLYPSVDAPVYSMNGGAVPDGFNLGMTNPNGSGTIYYTTDGSDPRLVGGAINPSAGIAVGSVSLTQSGPVKARVLQSGTWSALNEFEFIVGVAGSAAHLVVSELHYNPIGTVADTFSDKDDYEFIEILNLSTSETIELTGVHFTDGITFDFTGSNVTQLAPGARVVVVKNMAAFMERYPSVPSNLIAGVYTGSLDNAGERITIVDATEAAIKDFVYNDNLPWPASTDGDGFSLVLNCGISNPDHSLPGNWRSHQTLHGNPGGPDGTSWADFAITHGLSGSLTTDVDLDGTTDYYEYIYGTDPNDQDDDRPVDILLQSVFVDGQFQDYLTISVQRNLDAEEIVMVPEVTTDLLTWSEVEIEMVSSENQGDGTELILWRTTLPAFDPTKERCFMRLKILGK